MCRLRHTAAAKAAFWITIAAASPDAFAATGVVVGRITTMAGDAITTGAVGAIVNGVDVACIGGIPDADGFYSCTVVWTGTSTANVVVYTFDTGFEDQTSGNLTLAPGGQTTFNFVLALPDPIFGDGFEIGAALR